MVDERKISICIPTFNRFEMTIESFMGVYGDKRISEIIIVDDESDLHIYDQLKYVCGKLEKVKLYRNITNQDCYQNKMISLSYAINNWCILLDSDNEIDTGYIDKLFEIDNWNENTAYMPSFAKPTFNYEEFSGVSITKENVNEYFERPFFSTMLNCMNYFVNKNSYLEVWDNSVNPHTADSIYQNYNWLASGKNIYIVPNLHYNHLIHEQSHYKLNNHKTNGFYEVVENKIKQLV